MSIGEQLRNPIDVRFADPATEPVVGWCEANSARNAFDKEVLNYPACKVLAAHNNGTVYVYMPIQGTTMLESIGPNPAATPMQVAKAVAELVQGASLLAHGAGHREIHFLASDDNTAEGAKLMGFELLPYRVYRKKL